MVQIQESDDVHATHDSVLVYNEDASEDDDVSMDVPGTIFFN